jgi:lipooligosaccharide transport system permease protein
MIASSARHVAEYRLRNMWKWKRAILAYGLGGPVLYLTSIGMGVGALVDKHNGGQGIAGVPYLAFLAPALLASAAIQGGQDEVTFPTLAGFIWAKLFYAMHATSLTARQIADGVLLAAATRVVFTTVIYWLVLYAFGAVSGASALPLIVSGVLAGLAFSTVMLAVVARVKNDDSFFALLGRFVITPMFLFSGTFYPLQSLPMTVQWIGWLSPLWHATEIGRALSYGAAFHDAMFPLHAGFLAVTGLVGLLLAHRQFERRLSA